jgi:hypothetical protein
VTDPLKIFELSSNNGCFFIFNMQIPVKKKPASANISGVCSISSLHPSNVASLEARSSNAGFFGLYI